MRQHPSIISCSQPHTGVGFGKAHPIAQHDIHLEPACERETPLSRSPAPLMCAWLVHSRTSLLAPIEQRSTHRVGRGKEVGVGSGLLIPTPRNAEGRSPTPHGWAQLRATTAQGHKAAEHSWEGKVLRMYQEYRGNPARGVVYSVWYRWS